MIRIEFYNIHPLDKLRPDINISEFYSPKFYSRYRLHYDGLIHRTSIPIRSNKQLISTILETAEHKNNGSNGEMVRKYLHPTLSRC